MKYVVYIQDPQKPNDAGQTRMIEHDDLLLLLLDNRDAKAEITKIITVWELGEKLLFWGRDI